MVNYIRFNIKTGEILSTGKAEHIPNGGVCSAFPDELVIEGVADITTDTICKKTHVVLPNTRIIPKVFVEYSEARAKNYPSITEQLDMLWHGMNSGQIPKVDEFFNSIKVVKDTFPKGNMVEEDSLLIYSME